MCENKAPGAINTVYMIHILHFENLNTFQNTTFCILNLYEHKPVKTSLNDEVIKILVNYTHLIYDVLRSYPAIFMKSSSLFMEYGLLKLVTVLL